MPRDFFRAPLFLSMAACMLAGCSTGSTSSHIRRDLHQANVDSDYMVRLVHRSSKSREGWQAEQRSEQLSVEFVPRPLPSAEYNIARQPVSTWPSWSHFQFKDVEIRADEAGRRVWFIDGASGAVFGTVDRDSGATTGPGDDHPAWATRDGGRPLPR